MDEFSRIPKKYKGLPIAFWQSKKDSKIGLTLLNDIVLNIQFNMKEIEKEKMILYAVEKFGTDGVQNSHNETHGNFMGDWDFTIWKTKNVIFQIATKAMKKRDDTIINQQQWTLSYSDYLLENKIVNDYKNK